ncbi:MAG: FG-GAP-like repeat-containing protein [Balneolaceae bacterium]
MKNLMLAGIKFLRKYTFTTMPYCKYFLLGFLLIFISQSEVLAQDRSSENTSLQKNAQAIELNSSVQNQNKVANSVLADTLYDFSDGSYPDNFSSITSGTHFDRTTSSNTWTVTQSSETYGSGFSLKSGSITHNQNSNIGFLVNIGSDGGTLQFKFRTSSETDWDELIVTIEDSLLGYASGDYSWADSPVFDLPAGEYFIDFWYTKDGDTSVGLDAVFVDNIAITGLVEDSGEPLESQFAITSVTPNAAAPGTNVTIYGSQFSASTSANTVRFDGTSATVVSASETKLVVTVPDIEPGFAQVSVTNTNGTTDYASTFSVLAETELNFQLTDSGLPNVWQGSHAFEDVTGDGHLDLLITGRNSSNLRISTLYLNDGNGGFSDSGETLEGVAYSSVAFADVEGDGDPDLLITGLNSSNQNVSKLYLNDGNGGFSDSGQTLEGVNYGSVTFADVEGDGDPDLLITGINSSNQHISKLYLNDGNGGFSDSGQTLEGVNLSSVAFTDVEGDGDLDLLITGRNSSNLRISTLYLNDGNGGFSDSGETLEGVAYSSVAFADVEGDGDPDLLITGYNSSGQRISKLYLNDGNGGFSDSGETLEGVLQSSVAFADVEGDGDPDLLITGENSSNQYVSKLYLNNGNGGFSDSGQTLEGVRYSSVAFADVEGDGDLDLLISGQNNAGSAVTNLYENEGGANTSNISITDITPNAAAPGSNVTIYGSQFSASTSGNTVRFDGTSANVVSASETKLVVTVPNIDPGFAEVSVTNENGTAAYAGSFTVLNLKVLGFVNANAGLSGVRHGSSSFGDVDGDGDIDLLITGFNGSTTTSTLYTNDGNGGFSDSGVALEGVHRSSSSFGDVDGDGDLDLVISGHNGSYSTSTLYINDGNGSFSDSGSSLDGVNSGSSSFGDVDGDGDLDLVITGSTTSTLYTNDGDGSFSDSGIALEGVDYSSSSFGDVDDDGDLDLFITGKNGSGNYTSTLYTNDGVGGFSQSDIALEGVMYSSSSFGDVDGDGDLDLVISGYNGSGSSTLYTNDGNGGFSDSGIALIGVFYSFSSFGDVDGDGDLDLVISGHNGSFGTSTLYTNDGSGSFSNSDITLEGVYFGSSSFGDVNGDGDLDLVITGYNGSGYTSTLYENTKPPFTINKVEPKAAVPGTDVTLYGTGFSSNINDNMVSFGNTQAVINSASETKLVVTVPEVDPGPYTISVASGDDTGEYDGIFTVLSIKDPFFKPAFTGLEGLRYGSSDFEDVDNDGDLDLFVTGTTSSNARISRLLLNDGDGNFSDAETDIGSSSNSITVWGDIDNDGDKDLFISGVSSTGAVTSFLYQNDGSGNFTEVTSPIDGIYYGDAEFGDLDNDGDLDLVITGFNTSNQRVTKIYLNDGLGGFSYHSALEGVHFSSLAIGDINGDNFLDIQVSGINSSSVRVSRIYTNNGSGGFTNTASLEGVQYSTSDFFDSDNDGDLDLLITGYNSSSQQITKLYLNDGSGSYTDSGVSLEGVRYGSTSISDIDGNGYQDLFISGYNPSGLSKSTLYLNDGAGGFSSADISVEGTREGSVALGDINGDGDLDLFISGVNTAGQYISKLYENDFPPFVITNITPRAAAPGKQITIYGAGFYNNDEENEVTFGNTPADIISADTSKIVVTVPETDPGFSDISVSNDNGIANYSGLFSVLNSKRAYFTATEAALEAVYNSDVIFEDIDGDEDLDLLITGTNTSGQGTTKLYRNDGSGGYEEINSGLTAIHSGSTVFGDVDEDGDLDLFLSGLGSSTLYLNDGEGGFTDSEISFDGVHFSAAAFGDVDGDGDLDLVYSGYNSSNVRITKLYKNDGIGDFSDSGASLVGVQAGSVALGDVDGDTDLDLLLTGLNASGIRTSMVYLNDGSGSFTDSGMALEPVYNSSAVFGDVDSDGDLDILITGNNNSNQAVSKLFLNDSSGNFSDSGIIFEGAYNSSAQFADMDGDGNLDILYSGANPSFVDITKLYLNHGSLEFTDSELELEGVELSSLAAGDIDNDGDLDLLISGRNNQNQNFTKLYENIIPPGPSNLTATSSANSIDLDWSPSPLTNIGGHNIYRSTSSIADTSSELKINTELVTDTTYSDNTNLQENTRYFYRVSAVDTLTGEESVLSNEAVGNFKVKTIYASSLNGSIPGESITFYGTNLSNNPAELSVQIGDSSASVTTSSLQSVTVTVPDLKPGNYFVTVLMAEVELSLLNPITVVENLENESGHFQPGIELTNEAGGVSSVSSADLNKDGKFDVLSTFFQDNAVVWLQNNGDRDFEAASYFTTEASGASDVFAADLNNDGILDVISTSAGNDQVLWFEFDENTDFTQRENISETAQGAKSALATDVDLDGDLDVVIASESGNSINWYQNIGGGTFSPAQLISNQVPGVKKIHVADINADGYQDILSASETDDTIGLFLNNGDGTFSTRQVISNTQDGASSVYASDLNNDGNVDIISASTNNNTIAWFANNGDGTFSGSTIISDSLNGAFDVKVADFNGDGFQDVIASTNDGIIIWHESNGDNTFKEAVSITDSASGETTISVADYTGNGTLDVIAGSFGSNQILLFSNVDTPPAPPTGLAISNGIGSAALIWDANSENDILGYDILRTTDLNTEFSTVLNDVIPNTSYTDTGLQNARTYYYKVVAVDSSFNEVASESVEFVAIATQLSSLNPESGTEGTKVKISGVGFSADQAQNSVRFNDTEATILQSDSLSLLVEVPSGLSGLTHITVTSEDYEYVHPAPFAVVQPNDGTFSIPVSETGFGGIGNLLSADVDGDSDMDLMIPKPQSNRIVLYYSEGRNSYNSFTNFNFSGVSPKKVRVMNVAGTDYPDFIFISQLNNQFRVMKNNGNGATNTSLFTTVNISINNDTPEDIFPADMDNDGIADVLIASSGDNKISWYKNQSLDDNLSFGGENIVTQSANGVNSIFAADFNGDKLTDVVAAHASENLIMLYSDHPENGFTETVIENNLPALQKVIAIDIENDGDLDVLSASAGNNSIVLNVNDGSGNFSSGIEISNSVNGASDVFSADMNGDGLPDVLATSRDNDSVLLFMNNGGNSFSEPIVISSDESGALQVIAYDMQGDGRLDILSRSLDDGKISFFSNIQVQGLAVESILDGNEFMLTTDNLDMQWNTNLSDITDFASIISDALTVTNQKGETFSPTSFFADNSTLTIEQNSFYAADTLFVNISTEILRESSLGEFYMDVNNNGELDASDDHYVSPEFYTTLIGDFTRDYYVDFDDLVLFSEGWRNSDTQYETAPLIFTNSQAEFPNARVQNNGEFNIDDLVSFIRYWNLSQDLRGKSQSDMAAKVADGKPDTENRDHAKQTSRSLKNADISNYRQDNFSLVEISDTLQYISYTKNERTREYSSTEKEREVSYTFSLSHPDSVQALSLVLEYDSDEIEIAHFEDHDLFDVGNQNNNIFLSHIDSVNGLATFNIANFGSLHPLAGKEAFTVTFNSSSNSDSDITISADIRSRNKPTHLQIAKKSIQVLEDLPQSFELSQNYPNPFNPTTTIRYELAEQSRVSLDIYDILGRKIETLINQNDFKAGYYKTTWDASRYASGMYIYVLNIKSGSGKTHSLTKKMMMIK